MENIQSHSIEVPLLPGWGWRSIGSISGIAGMLVCYPSLFIAGEFLRRSDVNAFLDPSFKLVTVSLDYFTCLTMHSIIVLKNLVCYGRFVYSLAEDLLVDLVKFLLPVFSVSFLCSPSLTPNCLSISPMYTSSDYLQGILYITPPSFSLSILSFGYTRVY